MLIICHPHITAKWFGEPQKNWESVDLALGELSLPQFGGSNFLSDPCFFGCTFKEKLPIETFHISSCNKLVSKVPAQKKGGEVMTATNMCSNFGGIRYSLPLKGDEP